MSETPTKQLTPQSKVRKLLQSPEVTEQIQRALPNLYNAERFLRIVSTAITKNPKLAECTQSSLMTCILDCASLGIEADGRRAHLLPYFNKKANTMECQLIIDYKGLVELVLRDENVIKIDAQIVCENDIFDFNMCEVTNHKIDFRKDRGEAYAVYMMATLKNGEKKFEVMQKHEIENIKSRSKSSSFGPWKTDEFEMWKKTVIRRGSKTMPLSSETLELISKDDTQFDKPKVSVELPEEDIIEG